MEIFCRDESDLLDNGVKNFVFYLRQFFSHINKAIIKKLYDINVLL